MVACGHLLCVAKVNNAARASKVLHVISVAVAMFILRMRTMQVTVLSMIASLGGSRKLYISLRSFRRHVAMDRIPGNKLLATANEETRHHSVMKPPNTSASLFCHVEDLRLWHIRIEPHLDLTRSPLQCIHWSIKSP